MAAYKADFIFYDLLSKIYQRNYTENKLPTQRKLAEQYGVSRFTIQSVLNRMQHMGLIHSVQGDAIYIDVAVSKNPLMLNSMIERPYSEIQSRMVYKKQIPATSELSSIFSVEPGAPLWEYQRIRIVNFQITQVQTSWIPCTLVPELPQEAIESSIYDYILSLDLKIGHTISNYTAIAVDSATAALLQCKKNSPAMRIESRGILKDRTVFEYTHIISLDYGCTYIVPFNKKMHERRHDHN